MESLAEDIRTMVRRPLADDHVRAIRRIADEVRYAAGEMVAEVGDPMDRFIYVVQGEIEVVDPWTGARYLKAALGPTQFVGEIAPPSVDVSVTMDAGALASITDYEIPAMKAASSAYAQVFGREPVFMREGGSLPVISQFQQHLGVETVLMGFGLPDDRIHSPNERFYLPNYYRGIQTSIHFLAEYARAT